MAKAVTIKVKLVSSADTGFYYVAKKNSRTMTDKLVKKKYDPVARKHVEFREVQDQVRLRTLLPIQRGLWAPFLISVVCSIAVDSNSDLLQINAKDGGTGLICTILCGDNPCSKFHFWCGWCWEPRWRAPP